MFQLLEADRLFVFNIASSAKCIATFADSAEEGIRLAVGDTRENV